MPVTISHLLLNGSQLDARSLIQAERNEKALKRIQKKMMRARSTLDWLQSNNISCKPMTPLFRSSDCMHVCHYELIIFIMRDVQYIFCIDFIQYYFFHYHWCLQGKDKTAFFLLWKR